MIAAPHSLERLARFVRVNVLSAMQLTFKKPRPGARVLQQVQNRKWQEQKTCTATSSCVLRSMQIRGCVHGFASLGASPSSRKVASLRSFISAYAAKIQGVCMQLQPGAESEQQTSSKMV